ncbi:hypothetical protein [Streptomyces cinereoruber]|uniref:hypothetical protein n=1 Tax=Streptomyces cinereoruber TaxID=67260 RepID=UPI00363CF0BD
MRRPAPAALALLCAVLAGCSAPERSARPAPATGAAGAGTHSPAASAATPAAESAYTFRLPMARYSYTEAEYALVQSAEHVLAKRCMARYSLSYRPPAPAPPPPPVDRRYGLAEKGNADRFGYRLPPVPTPSPAPADERLGAAEILVLYGRQGAGGRAGKLEHRGKAVPEKGCLGQAMEDFRKGYEHPEGAEAASRIATRSHQESLTDPKVRAALGKWSACMAESGYSYASPMEPLGKYLEGPVTAEERATAGTDVACKRSTGLLETWFGVESEIQRRMIGPESAVLEELRDRHVRKVAAARRIVAEG